MYFIQEEIAIIKQTYSFSDIVLPDLVMDKIPLRPFDKLRDRNLRGHGGP